VALGLALAGLIVSALLAWIHEQAHAGGTSFCALSESLNCDRVALSPLSVQLGLPVAVWGIFGYTIVAALAASGLAGPRSGCSWPAGLLLVLSGGAAAVSFALAIVSKVAIGSWCLLCILSWAISLGLLATAWRACRHRGRWNAILDDLARLRARRLRTVVIVALVLSAIGFTYLEYPRYWEQGAVLAHPGSHHHGMAAPDGSLTIEEQIERFQATNRRQRTGPVQVLAFSDYECPSCARTHEQLGRLAVPADVTIVRRHFPLDSACNPAVTRQIHEDSCSLAHVAICAEAQGRLAEMEDALFANQREHAPVETLAQRVGLDMEGLRSCLASPDTERRLAADIAEGMRYGIQATPSFVVDGRVYAGRLPPELLPLAAGVHVH
jgi:uncharacterized membrane protein/predicted DsbA family dithiol-disulfide isomerase